MRHVRGAAILAIVSAQLAFGCRWRDTPLPSGLLEPYLGIESALTEDAISRVAEDAHRFAREAETLGAQGNVMRAAALKLQGAQTLEAARSSFGELSEALIAFGESTHASAGKDNRVVLCTMVQQRWIQRGDAIRNPYYGKAMLTCGTFQNALR
jgi:HPt (histidine-containing phosphotransfer) domain-containing protein